MVKKHKLPTVKGFCKDCKKSSITAKEIICYNFGNVRVTPKFYCKDFTKKG